MQNTNSQIICSFLILLGFFLSLNLAHAQSDMDFLLKNNEKYKDVIVKEIKKTDTIVLDNGEVVRLIGLKGLNTKRKRPELKRDSYGFIIEEPVSPSTPIEDQAFEFVRTLLQKQHVRLELDTEARDEDFTTLAYVFVVKKGTNQEIFVNEEILRQGFANLSIHPPNTKYADKLRAAYQEAREQKRGLQGQ